MRAAILNIYFFPQKILDLRSNFLPFFANLVPICNSRNVYHSENQLALKVCCLTSDADFSFLVFLSLEDFLSFDKNNSKEDFYVLLMNSLTSPPHFFSSPWKCFFFFQLKKPEKLDQML